MSTEYIDAAWMGSPDAMFSGLTSLGWQLTPSDEPVPMNPAVLGFTPVAQAQVDGADVWVCRIRSSEELPLPDGVTIAPEEFALEQVGVFA